jgi:GDP-4-dehydro-6-deoxy-D-mannose reductase
MDGQEADEGGETMTKRVFITGLDGFVASHLVDYILANHSEWEIYGSLRRMADKKNIAHVLDRVETVEMDVTDGHGVRRAIHRALPDKVFHLAGQTFVPTSWVSPAMTLETNAIGTVHLLEAIHQEAPDAFVQVAGSSEEYGYVLEKECPIQETQPLRPLSPYGVSKVAEDLLGQQYAKSYGLNIVVTRSFNMTGPRRGEEFADSNFAKQIAEMEKGKRKAVKHGDLSSVRDFTDVRDSVRAYWALSERRWRGDVFNVCSGKGHSMNDVLYRLLDISSVENAHLVSDPQRLRPSDVPFLIGSNAKIRRAVGWKREIEHSRSLQDLLDHWRGRVFREGVEVMARHRERASSLEPPHSENTGSRNPIFQRKVRE